MEISACDKNPQDGTRSSCRPGDFCIVSLFVHNILNQVAKILHPAKQPSSCHGEAYGADEKGEDQQDNSILYGVCNKYGGSQQANNGTGKAEEQGGAIEGGGTNPHKQCQYKHDGSGKNF